MTDHTGVADPEAILATVLESSCILVDTHCSSYLLYLAGFMAGLFLKRLLALKF